ncbi:hypothetical protein [Rhodobacter sp. 24-YEA-8]|uniref:hypothetical protein n=1 Tax=Rhodobacter sp. 24-YEA-8 TaxID=1884310 RepID=UPI00089A31F7|nr:hypothetical protein [Rhodobacter sp. 24-YEA-8]SEC28142.1 hypothetical protein SAMN05519105_2281 [Rhodobacter sp. 24-YEA-8]
MSRPPAAIWRRLTAPSRGGAPEAAHLRQQGRRHWRDARQRAQLDMGIARQHVTDAPAPGLVPRDLQQEVVRIMVAPCRVGMAMGHQRARRWAEGAM